MKWLIVLIWFFPTLVLADEFCPDDLYYFDPNADQASCIHKYGGTFNSELNDCVYAFDRVEQTFCENPTPPPEGVKLRPIEKDVDKLSLGVLDPQIREIPNQKVPDTFWDNIQLTFQGLLDAVGFFFRSEAIHKAYTPQELKPATGLNPLEQVGGFLGGSTGFFGLGLPKEVLKEEGVEASEELYRQAHFPQEAN